MRFESSRVLGDEFPRREYKPTKDSSLDAVVVKGLHFGQRKLILSEIEFLCALVEKLRLGEGNGEGAASKPILVVYAGAANGSHLPFLFTLFPGVRFVLVDPAPFCDEVSAIAREVEGPVAEIVQDYCTDELCLRLSRTYGDRYTVALVSDIRSGTPKRMQKNKDHTEMMLRDNALQRGLCWSLRAYCALLKFHPPYPAVTDLSSPQYDPEDDTPESIEYLNGTQLFGVWAPKSSSEVRLAVEGPFTDDFVAPTRRYHCLEHEEQCYYYNTTNRYKSDCDAERAILHRYLRVFPDVVCTVEELSSRMSTALRFPLFHPLKSDFTEDHARWLTLLYSCRMPHLLSLFDELKNVVTLGKMRELVKAHCGDEDVPAGVRVGDVELPSDFWVAVCKGDLTEAYSFPKVRFGFFRRLQLTSALPASNQAGSRGSGGRGDRRGRASDSTRNAKKGRTEV